MQCMRHITSEIMEYSTKWFRVKLDLGGVTSVRWRRNHQKYKRRMEQPREVGMTSPLWNFGVQRWELIRSAWSAGELSTGFFHLIVVSPFLISFYFVSQCFIHCRSTITAYVISRTIISPQKPDTVTLHFHVISAVSGRNRSIVSVIVDVLIVIWNSAVLF